MGNPLDKLTIKGFKSIRELEDFELKQLNVLIGGNGAGKSNFVEIFRLLRAMVDQTFANFILTRGGADDFLFNGPKVTKIIDAQFKFGLNDYAFELEPTAAEKFIIKTEKIKYKLGSWNYIGNSDFESRLPKVKDDTGLTANRGVGYYVYEAVSDWTIYHFHDTSANSPMRRSEIVEDNRRLRSDAANIAPFLLGLMNGHFKRRYQEIIDAIRLVTPFFDDFILEPVQKGEKETVKLSWKQKGSDYPMQPYHFSDGTIRFICLATALLQPIPPSTVIIDEPELGLHPSAISILAELIQDASKRTQIIVATQSPALIDHFSVEDVIVVNRKDGASTFERLQEKDLNVWLETYSVGELWSKNVIAGGPVYE
ncbi:MAG: AAA family ATPase [Desulfobacteraceae bacterium]|jgi:predicted ATPase|nr:AAA family ATPase [Desulfobacteraceae bacterium]